MQNRRKIIYWKENDFWLGYLQDFPDYQTQGESLDELKENLKDIFKELTSGNIPSVRRTDEIEIS